MQFKGQILKMSSVIGTPINYYLNLSGDLISMNQLFGKNFNIKHVGYQCVECNFLILFDLLTFECHFFFFFF